MGFLISSHKAGARRILFRYEFTYKLMNLVPDGEIFSLGWFCSTMVIVIPKHPNSPTSRFRRI